MMQNFKVIEKNNLTKDVYEIVFEWEKLLEMLPWQFVTFILDKIWWRAYSILELKWKKIVLIIKKWELDNWWRWGSKFICNLKIWDIIKWVWPAWHFLLKETEKNKLFIWTWTWLVPLYNQIILALEKWLNSKLKLIFWVRTINDLFYIKQFEELKNQNSNFDFEIYLSRDKDTKYNSWYVTDFLNKENTQDFEEFYICWAPGMIDSATEILEKNWKTEIYFEKY